VKRVAPGTRKALLTLHVSVSVALVGGTASVLILCVRGARGVVESASRLRAVPGEYQVRIHQVSGRRPR
jgi:hypothetical protein